MPKAEVHRPDAGAVLEGGLGHRPAFAGSAGVEAASHALETRKTMAGIEKDEASAARTSPTPGMPAAGLPEQRVNAEMKMADDYRSATKNFSLH